MRKKICQIHIHGYVLINKVKYIFIHYNFSLLLLNFENWASLSKLVWGLQHNETSYFNIS